MLHSVAFRIFNLNAVFLCAAIKVLLRENVDILELKQHLINILKCVLLPDTKTEIISCLVRNSLVWIVYWVDFMHYIFIF